MRNLASFFATILLFTTIPPALHAQQRNQNSQPGTKWNEQELRQAVAPARVGKKLTPPSWPNHARVAVCLSFDVDNESYLLAAGETSPSSVGLTRWTRRVASNGIPIM